MTAVMTLKERYEQVRERIDRAAAQVGRDGESILLVAVGKYADPEDIMELVELGHRDFGESRPQQLIQRSAMLDEWLARRRKHTHDESEVPEQIRWHLLGELQRNKVRKIVEHTRLIHSVDSMRVAEEIQTVGLRLEEPIDVLLQVNCSGEAGKRGIALPAALHVAEQIDSTTYVRLRGLMVMAPYSDDPEDSRFTFERGRECFEEVHDAGIASEHFSILSMGMSADFEVAIECGANLVRVGSAIFGSDEPGAEAS
ncbi:MAG: YggS family pyridoxal phosphate-dependent enzyme [Phycisphaerales bacterium JB043]